MIRSLEQIETGEKRVFVRADFNVPLNADGSISDATRIEAALPTLRSLKEQGARLIVASHLGRPKGEVNRKFSLLPVAEYLTEALLDDVIFPENCVGAAVVRLSKDLKAGSVMLLENLRFHPGETENDPLFSEKLASLGDVYINEAFGTLHRAHASTVGMVSHFKEKGMGYLVEKELQELGKLVDAPARPFWAIIGGAKVADKIGLIDRLLDKVDGIALGGGLAYTFLKAQGHEIGRSRLEEEKLHIAGRILERARAKDVQILLPTDHRVAAVLSLEAEATISEGIAVPPDQIGLDIGPQTAAHYAAVLGAAGTIFWNGPLGYFENDAFAEGTREVARAVAESDAYSVIGGGDSVAALKSLGMEQDVSHISTGGGASLAFLEGRELPGLKALEEID